jgi:anaerobic ribonucleoside-triphosphate reductase activating protein
MTPLAISRVHFPVTTLGPGQRLGIWFQGCSIRCPGCISVDTWPHDTGLTTVEGVLDALCLWLASADGITISGGEPFDQRDALGVLLGELRARHAGDILVYSGYSYESLGPWLQSNRGLIDALITEPYDEHESQTLALRGSDNQRLHLLTDLGGQRFATVDQLVEPKDRRLDVMFDEEGAVWFAGIPTRDDLRRFRSTLEAAGHDVALSAVISDER